MRLSDCAEEKELLSWSGAFSAGSGMTKGWLYPGTSFWLLVIVPMFWSDALAFSRAKASLSQAFICWLGWKYLHSSPDLETLSLSASFLTCWPLQSLTQQSLPMWLIMGPKPRLVQWDCSTASCPKALVLAVTYSLYLHINVYQHCVILMPLTDRAVACTRCTCMWVHSGLFVCT